MSKDVILNKIAIVEKHLVDFECFIAEIFDNYLKR